MRTALITGSLLLATTVLLTGCGREVPLSDGLAGPVTGPSATAPAGAGASAAVGTAPPASPSARTPTRPAPPTRPPSRPATSKPPASPLTLGPDGFGALKIGMTRKAATATGLIKSWKGLADRPGCYSARLADVAAVDGGGSVLTGSDGLVGVITVSGGIRTPEGARIGMTYSRLKQLYPGVSADSGAIYEPSWVVVPGNPDARYWFGLEDGRVAELSFGAGQNCYD